jgi:hypothetical protein
VDFVLESPATRGLGVARARVERAAAELAAARQAIEGDALAVAHRTLHDALRGGETAAVLEFNRRLREHFDAFVVDSDGSAVPIWKVEVPDPLARQLAKTLDAAEVAAYVERRVAELGLLDRTLSETGPDAHA